jgi:hypothetical protein
MFDSLHISPDKFQQNSVSHQLRLAVGVSYHARTWEKSQTDGDDDCYLKQLATATHAQPSREMPSGWPVFRLFSWLRHTYFRDGCNGRRVPICLMTNFDGCPSDPKPRLRLRVQLSNEFGVKINSRSSDESYQ